MICRRCGGLMIVEPFYDHAPVQTISEEGAMGMRCVNCGNIEDAVIHTNRLEPRSLRRAERHNLTVEVDTGSATTENSCKRAGGQTA